MGRGLSLERQEELLKLIAEMYAGDKDASLRVASLLSSTIGGLGQFIPALMMESLAKSGHAPSMVALAAKIMDRAYSSSEDKLQAEDRRQAQEWYEQAAAQEDPEALYQLGLLRLEQAKKAGGKNKNPHYEAAYSFFQRAGVQQHPRALYQMGLLYVSGKGIERSVERALQCYGLAEIAASAKSDLSTLQDAVKARGAILSSEDGRQLAIEAQKAFTPTQLTIEVQQQPAVPLKAQPQFS